MQHRAYFFFSVGSPEEARRVSTPRQQEVLILQALSTSWPRGLCQDCLQHPRVVWEGSKHREKKKKNQQKSSSKAHAASYHLDFSPKYNKILSSLPKA